MDNMLEVTNLRVAYVKKEILCGANLNLAEGEIVVVIGMNGSGKSTLLRSIAGLLRPRAGDISYCSHGKRKSLIGLQAHQINRLGVGYLIQGGQVFPRLTVRENLDYSIMLHSGDAKTCSRVEEAFDWFPHLKNAQDRRAGLLSGGDRQMLAISTVLVQKPRVLLLDEPSAGLAPGLVPEVLGLVRSYCDSQGCAAILVEQNVRQSLTVANRSVHMAQGLLHDSDGDALGEIRGLLSKGKEPDGE